jgi:hypothetical protein
MSLKKYNQILLALVLTLVFLGVAFIWYFALRDGFFGRQRGTPSAVVSDSSDVEAGIERSLVFCLPTIEPETGTKFVGVAVIDKAQPNEESFLGSGSKFTQRFSPECSIGDTWGPAGSIQNVVVVPSGGSGQQLLFEQPVMVTKLSLPRSDSDGSKGLAPAGRLYWEIREHDSNNDGVINSEDAVAAYLSALDGSDLSRITPPKSNLVSIERDSGTNALIMQVQYDSDSDGAFGPRDTVELLEYPLSTRGPVGPLLESVVVQRSQELLE